MLGRIFGKKKITHSEDTLVNSVVIQTAVLINDLQKRMELRFNELSSQVKEVELGLAQMETKLLTKDLKDKQAYGLLHYKLHEVKNPRLQEDIDALKNQLAARKPTLKDQ